MNVHFDEPEGSKKWGHPGGKGHFQSKWPKLGRGGDFTRPSGQHTPPRPAGGWWNQNPAQQQWNPNPAAAQKQWTPKPAMKQWNPNPDVPKLSEPVIVPRWGQRENEPNPLESKFYNSHICQTWRKDPYSDPEIEDAKLTKTDLKYKHFRQRCGKPHIVEAINYENDSALCNEWRLDKSTDPISGLRFTEKNSDIKDLFEHYCDPELESKLPCKEFEQDPKNLFTGEEFDDETAALKEYFETTCFDAEALKNFKAKQLTTGHETLVHPKLKLASSMPMLLKRSLNLQAISKAVNDLKDANDVRLTEWKFCLPIISSTFKTTPVRDRNYSNFRVIKNAGEIPNGKKVNIIEISIETDQLVAMRKGTSDLSISGLDKTLFPLTIKTFNLLNELIYGNYCPNFSLTAQIKTCDIFHYNTTLSSFTIFQEAADFSLQDSTSMRFELDKKKTLHGLLCQALIAVHAIHSKYGLAHRTIAADSFYIQAIPQDVISYTIDDQNYHIQTNKMLLTLGNFENPRCIKPPYNSNGFLGERVAIVNGDILEPITCKFTGYEDNNQIKTAPAAQLKWNDPSRFQIFMRGTMGLLSTMSLWGDGPSPNLRPETIVGTYHHIYSGIDLGCQQQLDWNDTDKIPDLSFFTDIQDTILSFVGGKSWDNVVHKPLTAFNAKDLNEIKRKCFIQKFPYYTQNTVQYLRADKMMALIYMPYNPVVAPDDHFVMD